MAKGFIDSLAEENGASNPEEASTSGGDPTLDNLEVSMEESPISQNHSTNKEVNVPGIRQENSIFKAESTFHSLDVPMADSTATPSVNSVMEEGTPNPAAMEESVWSVSDNEDGSDGVKKRAALSNLTPSYDTMVSVHSGSNKRDTFSVHKDLLSHHSPWFKAACNHKDSKSEINLPAQKPAVFAEFKSFIYSGPIDRTNLGKLFRCYLFAHEFQTIRFANAVIDPMFVLLNQEGSIPTRWISRAYASTSSVSPLHRLLIDMTCWHWKQKFSEQAREAYPAEYVYELAIALTGKDMPRKRYTKNDIGGKCKRYHVHNSTFPMCYASSGSSSPDQKFTAKQAMFMQDDDSDVAGLKQEVSD